MLNQLKGCTNLLFISKNVSKPINYGTCEILFTIPAFNTLLDLNKGLLKNKPKIYFKVYLSSRFYKSITKASIPMESNLLLTSNTHFFESVRPFANSVRVCTIETISKTNNHFMVLNFIFILSSVF